MMYSFDLDGAVEEIKENNPKKVLLHLPDGLKPRAKEIQDYLKSKVDSEILIWAGSCFGACDLPVESKNIGIDLIIHFGHTKWRYD
jgi:diphthamide biosynthesis enzyme Dph1/Dph2-like protein